MSLLAARVRNAGPILEHCGPVQNLGANMTLRSRKARPEEGVGMMILLSNGVPYGEPESRGHLKGVYSQRTGTSAVVFRWSKMYAGQKSLQPLEVPVTFRRDQLLFPFLPRTVPPLGDPGRVLSGVGYAGEAKSCSFKKSLFCPGGL